MNYGLMLSNHVEERLCLVDRTGHWAQSDEAGQYARCLNEVLDEEQGRAWADGNIRIGDYILLSKSTSLSAELKDHTHRCASRFRYPCPF
jgi:hypothetical protein